MTPAARLHCLLGHVALALSLGACAGETRTVLPHPELTPGARANLELARVQQIALHDYGVLNPDEFAGVAPDPGRRLIYVGTRAGSLLALSMETGDVVWEQQFPGAISSVPKLALDGELMLLGTDNGDLLAIELETRKTRWSYSTLGTIRNEPLVREGTVFVVNSRDQVFALELKTGAWRWQYEQPYPTEFTVHGHAGLSYLAGEGVVTQTPDQAAAAAGIGAEAVLGEPAEAEAEEEPSETTGDSPAGDGETAVPVQTGGAKASASGSTSAPANAAASGSASAPASGSPPAGAVLGGEAANGAPSSPPTGTIFTGFSNGKVAAIGAQSGEPMWLANAAPPAGGDFVDADGTPLILTDRGELVVTGQSTGVYGLALADGLQRWYRPLRGAGTVVAGPRGLMIVASALEGVFALEHGGRVRWRQQLNPGFVQTPLVVGDIAFIAHSDDGLLAYDVETGEYLANLNTGSGISGPPVYDAELGRFYTMSNRGMLVVFRTVEDEARGFVRGAVESVPSAR
ncbi:outer membrane protein assembly factor BamB family protein [Nannocystis bainbridge]|uniref:PQQ-binding-like beta-propeller repeat protein n=1 Tax=Nannocystis bainbridge TaxID=2995303 RepID=A0ABT5E2D2_9BACT|nr:PQQ-binding-like beta-propeller repeat protein [Nannocystis bainbridge]MDC0720025.1 PQQ-binding-like beta-propeller repeat protein [Nannocystis bainbridge]